jgi:hypothetical protein
LACAGEPLHDRVEMAVAAVGKLERDDELLAHQSGWVDIGV